MNVKSVEKLENSTAKVVLEIERTQFQAALDKAYRKVKNDIYIPGFRKGKAPRKIVEGMYGAQVFYEDAINLMFPDVWAEACEKEELAIVGMPSIADLNVEENGDLTLTVETGLYPEVTLGEYKGLEVEKAEVSVSDEEVEAEVQKLVERNSSVSTADRAAKEGDTVVIDFEGFDNGVPFEGGAGANQNLKLGSGTFIPGFEEQLVGMSAGEEKDIDVTFPEDYGAAELAGKPVVFKVKVHEVKETVAPVIDDEFAKDVSETADTVEDLKKELSEKLLKEKTENAESAFKNAAIDAAINNMTAVIPDGMIDEQVENIMNQYSMSMQQSGFTLESYAQMMGTTIEGLRESTRPNALAQIKYNVLLEKIAEVEGIEVTETDVEEEYQKMAEEYGMEIEKVKEYLPAEQLMTEKKLQKASDIITDSAVAVAPKAE